MRARAVQQRLHEVAAAGRRLAESVERSFGDFAVAPRPHGLDAADLLALELRRDAQDLELLLALVLVGSPLAADQTTTTTPNAPPATTPAPAPPAAQPNPQTQQPQAQAQPQATATTPAPDPPVARAAGPGSVSIVDYSFSPGTISVNVGDTVTWTNSGKQPHNATGSGISTGTLKTGQSGSHTFTKAGTFSYICSIHPFMKGAVVVRAASSGGGSSGGGSGSGATGSNSGGGSGNGASQTGSGGPSEAAAAGSTGSGLPATGADAAVLAGLGVLLLGLGYALRRRAAPG